VAEGEITGISDSRYTPRAASVAPEQICPMTPTTPSPTMRVATSGAHVGIADIVFDHQFDLLAQQAAVGIPFLDHQLGGPDARDSVRGQVTGMGPATPILIVSGSPAPQETSEINSSAATAIKPSFFILHSFLKADFSLSL
jgi:hypothetical protein